MPILNKVVFGSWFVFFVYWLVSASDVKKDVDSNGWRRGRYFSLGRVAIVVALLAMFPEAVKRVFGSSLGALHDATISVVGVTIMIAGLAFAIWARRHLGRNWSSHPALKENHELVTTGPYNLVRHPIYTGMLTGLLGSFLVSFSAVWFYALIIMGVTIAYRIHAEEGIMMRTFPDAYPVYRMRTKALIPFIW